MKKIATVAIAALESARKSLVEPGWDKENYDLYKSWMVMRDASNTSSMNEWRDFICRLIDGLIFEYKKESKSINLRDHWTESGNMHVGVCVMGGYRQYSKWEVAVRINVTDHKDRNRVYRP